MFLPVISCHSNRSAYPFRLPHITKISLASFDRFANSFGILFWEEFGKAFGDLGADFVFNRALVARVALRREGKIVAGLTYSEVLANLYETDNANECVAGFVEPF